VRDLRRLKAIISYDGTHFSGYQAQPGKRTVQSEIEKVLTVMHKGEHIRIFASGRTDARVHATGQVIHFDTTLSIPAENYKVALNAQLPADVRILDMEEVSPDFHARFDAKGKRYRYKWNCDEVQSPFKRNYTVETRGRKPDVSKMENGAAYLVGTHDFTSFCAASTPVDDKVRTIYSIDFEWHDQELHMVIEGSGFLYNMVRIIAGTLWEVGIGKREAKSIKDIIESKNREMAGTTAPPHGLYLEKVYY
jgi:tRNA pseudouridine38-40 synthase